ncbi:BTAD domain-containing putative transcriptional regulator [Streptomyces sp. MS19]|uniref:BTAD domain-containing putative transcriptional regulator n=1 Tax=Streptomyces sp. MS19 TaxID=3385972 RepID=UPI0039A19B60
MQVGILGPLEVASSQGRPVAVTGGRLRTLLTRLALDAGRTVRGETLVDALWGGGEVPGDQANALQSLVSRLRRALPDPGLIVSAPGGYRLAVPRDAVDAVRFERLADEGRRALAAGDTAEAVTALRAALALWRGPALADAADAPFAAAPATRLEELRLAAREDLYDAEVTAGRAAAVVAGLEELAAAHPLRERPRALLIRARYATGGQAEALGAYEEYRALLADELGVDPSPELRGLHLSVLRADSGLAPAAPPPQAPVPGNLRSALTSFIGREEELGLIAKRLDESRLVTLVGPGGAGKTRLAATTAAGLSEGFPGGAWLVELAPVTDSDDVPQAVLDALGRRVTGVLERPRPPGSAAPPRDALGMLTEVLAAAPTLLVLDNCEHLVDAAARLADHLLGHCPGLRVLATSREPLGITGESLSPVPPLSTPGPGATPDEALASAAVQLFADRAAAVRPGFTVHEENVAAVTEICRRLDGLPLGIELAAARLRAMEPAHLATRLDDRFRLLTGGSRTALPRHRTLHAVVAWSWELLTDAERDLAAALAVFPGGITPETAEGVCGVPADDVLDLLLSLADKSLLQPAEADEPSDGPRFRMLETLREYGVERLTADGRLRTVRDAHAAYFLRLAETAEPHLRSGGQLPWIKLLMAERDNLLAALHHSTGTGDAETAVRLCAALALYWTMRGTHGEAANWMSAALDIPGDPPLEPLAVVLGVGVINIASTGDPRDAHRYVVRLRRALDALGERADRHPVIAVFKPGLAFFEAWNSERRRPPDVPLDHPEPWTRAMLRLMRAAIRENEGEPGGMREDLEVAVAAFREVGDRWGLSMALTSLGELNRYSGDDDTAAACLEDAMRLMDELHTESDAEHLRVRLAVLHGERDDVARAEEELERYRREAEQRGEVFVVVLARQALGDIHRRAGRLTRAREEYEAAGALLEQRSFVQPQLSAAVRCGKAAVLLELDGAVDEAARQVAQALRDGESVWDMPVIGMVGTALAGVTEARGDLTAAAELLGASEAVRGLPYASNPDIARFTARLRGELGDAGFEAAYAVGAALSRTEALTRLRLAAVGPDGKWEEHGEQAG